MFRSKLSGLIKIFAVLLLSVFLVGCPQLVPIAQGVMNAAHWIGSIIEVADQSQRTWFGVNPDTAKQIEAERAVFRARKALAALNGIALATKSVDDKDLVVAKKELVEAYKALEALFLSLNVPIQPGMKAMDPPRIVESGRVEQALAVEK